MLVSASFKATTEGEEAKIAVYAGSFSPALMKNLTGSDPSVSEPTNVLFSATKRLFHCSDVDKYPTKTGSLMSISACAKIFLTGAFTDCTLLSLGSSNSNSGSRNDSKSTLLANQFWLFLVDLERWFPEAESIAHILSSVKGRMMKLSEMPIQIPSRRGMTTLP